MLRRSRYIHACVCARVCAAQDPAVRKERERLERIRIKAEEEADRVWREARRKEFEELGEDQRWASPSPSLHWSRPALVAACTGRGLH